MKKKEPMLIEFTEQIALAYNLLEKTEKNIFLTGRAGTGKSTLLKYFIENTKKNVVVLAPTGVAAVNIGGQTIHSFFKFGIDITIDKIKRLSGIHRKIYKTIDTIVIDEISMVRADLLDCIDKFMRLNGRKKGIPFGGTQMVLIGDIYQLPPVVKGVEREIFTSLYKSPYFFDANAFKNADFEFVELEKVFRQKDKEFLDILNAIRNNTIDEGLLNRLNSRVDEHFIPNKKDMYVHLTTTNSVADNINTSELSRLKGRGHTLIGEKNGDFDDNYLPTDIYLKVKPQSQIMLINNDSNGRWINGTLGRILEIEDKEDENYLIVELENKEIVEVTHHTWRIINYKLDRERNRIITEEIGRFTQFPIMLAWAITIHKSQGKTFDKIILDISGGTFAHGQMYVALSRCRTLQGIVLRRPIKKQHIIMDRRVVKFITDIQYHQAEKYLPSDEKEKILNKAIEDNAPLLIVYLKRTDEKSRRRILPLFVGEIEYNGVKFIGVKAKDLDKGEDRTFRLDRIIEISPHDS